MTNLLGMKAISIHQPYAGLIATGAKTIETRPWATKHRGPLVICSTGRWHPNCRWVKGWNWVTDLGPLVEEDEHATKIFDLFGCDADQIEGAKIYQDADQSAISFYGSHWEPGVALGIANVTGCLPIIDAETGDQTGWNVPHITPLLHSKYGTWSKYDGQSPGVNIASQIPRGDFSPGNYGFLLDDFQPFEKPIPIKGQQQIWTIKPTNLKAN